MDHFDVGFNFLNGSLPSNLRSWKGITTLILRENRFMGGIPDFLSEFITLRELQLGGNLFGGKIPRSLGKLHNMFYGLNLSANGLTGDIPSEFGALQALQSLDVSLNNLTGSIDVLESLFSLIEVNISYNFFNGPIPKHLMKLLNSSPSSFMGNPLLCISCSPSDGLSCIKTIYVKPCVNGSTDHKGISKFGIVMIELVSSIVISAMLIIIIRKYLHKQELKGDSESGDLESEDFGGRVHMGFSILQRGGGRIGLIYEQEVNISGKERSSSLKNKVLKATDNLNECYIIGRGAHGVVYKAQIGGLRFAVKKFAFEGRNRKHVRMMCNEVQALGMIRHRNLISYADYWIGQDYGLILYEYMQNGSLHDILHEKQPPAPLSWTVRLRIAVGIAQGLAYLHYDCKPPIVHRDIKPKNILLDDNMEPLIADFGTALLRDLSEQSYSHSEAGQRLSTYVAGTPGYIAPEKAYAVVPTRKSDVYSYGVVLLELITRRGVLVPSLNDEKQVSHLVSWTRSVWMETGKIEKIADPYLASAFPNSAVVAKQVTEVLLLALQCTERNVRERPTMKEIIDYYQKGIFKWRCDDVIYGDESTCDVAPQPYSSLSLFILPDVPFVFVDHRFQVESNSASNLRHTQVTFVVTESEYSNDFSFWEEANQFQLGVYDWDDWKLMSRPMNGIDGLVVKLMGNGKIQAVQVVVTALIVSKITFIWPSLVFLPSIIGPVLSKPFNWFFLSRLAQYMLLQKSLDSQFVFGSNMEKITSIKHKEIQTHGITMHQNLVKYLDHWIGPDYALVIYKYIENGSLHDILHEKKPLPPLTWCVRFNIAVGIAQALPYLHYDCIPSIEHRDIKSKNILLDNDMEPLIAEFAIALLRDLSEYAQAKQMHFAGTAHYIALENTYAIVKSRKSDVYSYGVVLLELITRRKVLNDEEQVTHLVGWARSVWMETGQIEKIADSDLASAFPNSVVVAKQVTEVLLLALRCTERAAHKRPNMKEVIDYYQKGIFKWRCDDVVYGDEVASDVDPLSSCSLSLFLDGESSSPRLTQATFDVVTESEDPNDFIFWQEANQFQLGVYNWDDWKLMSRPTTGVDGLVVKLMGNGKIQAVQVMVMPLTFPKITYTWPCLIFLPSVLGPVLTKPFNRFFLSRLAQYMHLQKSLDSQPKSYSENTSQGHSSTW